MKNINKQSAALIAFSVIALLSAVSCAPIPHGGQGPRAAYSQNHLRKEQPRAYNPAPANYRNQNGYGNSNGGLINSHMTTTLAAGLLNSSGNYQAGNMLRQVANTQRQNQNRNNNFNNSFNNNRQRENAAYQAGLNQARRENQRNNGYSQYPQNYNSYGY